ncbi:hypothetical protein R16034_00020 [Ralstonia edaphis]|uniref:Uncharacterized protein n=1 Tax=Ralstonia edaphi TaxID=3058599 RepID=A0AB72WVX1_9RALS|nr:DUF5677 domain-containing protein [Ralstonia sp. LMG 6871]CAJ0734840.1 hypothetical protein R16034_00020 [Ralstonia sp. LMG 6871]
MSDDRGFLAISPESIANIRRDYESWFAAAERFNELAMQVLRKVKPNGNSEQQVVGAALYGRALTSLQAALVLSERGMIADARTVVRAAAETVIVLSALAKDSGVCSLLLDRHVWHHAKMQRVWLNDRQIKAQLTPAESANVSDTLAAIEAQFPQSKTLKVDPVAIATLAATGGVTVLYNSVFRATSGDAAHTTLDTLNRHVRVDSHGDIIGMKFGPCADDLAVTLSDAISVIGFGLHAVADLFQIPELVDQLAECVAEWKALGAPAEYIPGEA